MPVNCTPLQTSLATHLKSAFTTVDTDTIIILLPELTEIEVEVNDRIASNKTPGSSMDITTAASEYTHIEVILYVSKSTGNRHLIERYREDLTVIEVKSMSTEAVISDEEVYLERACIEHRKVTQSDSHSNLCFHDFISAKKCLEEVFDLKSE